MHRLTILALTFLLSTSALAAEKTKPEKRGFKAEYHKGMKFLWTQDLASHTIVKQLRQTRMNVNVKHHIVMDVLVAEVAEGLPTKLEIAFKEHKVTVSKASPIKPKLNLKGHKIRVSVDPAADQQLKVIHHEGGWPEGKETDETLGNLLFLPLPLADEPVDFKSLWKVESGYLGAIYSALIKKRPDVAASLVPTKTKAPSNQFLFQLQAAGNDTSTEDGFDAKASGELKRTATFDAKEKVFLGYQEDTVLTADAKTPDGRTFSSTVTVKVTSETKLTNGANAK